MKKIILLITALFLLASCAKSHEQSDKLQVYTSFYPMYDFARTIGGDDIDLYNIVPVGTEPHDFEPTAADMAKLSKADVFIYNGRGVDEWAEDIAKTLPDTVFVINTSAALSTYYDGDPHTWLSPFCAAMQAEKICKSLETADSQNAGKYRERMNSLSSQLDELYWEYFNAGFVGMKLFVTHGAYNALCKDYEMTQIALEGTAGESDPSPAQMAEVVNQIKADGAKYIFYDPLEGDKTASAAAKEAGIETLPLYTFEGDTENRDYVTVMRFNLEQLKKARQ
ncbi:MAG: zinc ABC transporter substrate-binding protein [Oscillospiraceae bacterium]|nr:zinc ABC transporter substrate-binding protein [Oscillospiraceae bacterium]